MEINGLFGSLVINYKCETVQAILNFLKIDEPIKPKASVYSE